MTMKPSRRPNGYKHPSRIGQIAVRLSGCVSKALAVLALATCAFAGGSAIDAASADEVFVTSEKDNTVAVIDTETLTAARKFKVGKRPRGGWCCRAN